MKKLFFFLLIAILAFNSCQKKEAQVRIIKAPDYQKAESLLYHQNDSAFYYFNKVVTSSKDSFLVALAYNNMAVIQSDAADHFGCQESLSQSLRFLNEQKKRDRSCLASDYNELGLTSINLKNYDAAIPFYDAALKFCDYKDFQLVILNNKALAYQKKGAYREALKIYKAVLAETKKGGIEYARILSNIAKTQWLLRPGYKAAPELLTALAIRIKNKDLAGQNASYAHLADYYAPSKPDSALFYAGKMYATAQQIDNPDDRIEALQKLIRLSPPHPTKHYFLVYQQLSDSLQAARNAAKNQFALIRYEVQKNKSDNLKLQKDNTEKKYQIIRQNIIMGIIIFLMITGIIITMLWYRKRKQRLEMEAQNAIREIQLRTSKKVHDVVANGLYRIITEIEYQDLDKERLLDNIDILYQQSRDISYEKPQSNDHDFDQKISGLISSFASAKTKVLVAGNNKQLWKDISAHARYEVEHILQELMVNMAKHSQAATVVIRFEQHEKNINIYYTDDGIGLPAEFKQGNGLTNTGNRIKELNGSISFDGNTEKGLKIRISFPIA